MSQKREQMQKTSDIMYETSKEQKATSKLFQHRQFNQFLCNKLLEVLFLTNSNWSQDKIYP